MSAIEPRSVEASAEQPDTDTDVQGIPAVIVDSETGPLAGIHLLCVAGHELGKSFPVSEGSGIIGRGHGDVSLSAADISRNHARISRGRGRFWIEDLGSTNGTHLNGTAIDAAAELRFGDRVQVGSTILVFSRNDELEQRLRQLQKLDAMGGLVKGIAHDFNNTLQVLLVGLDQLNGMAATDEMQCVVEEMMHAATSGTGLIRRLLRIGRDKPETLDLVELDMVMRNCVEMARRLMPSNIQVEIAAEADVLVRGSRSELEQALLNLLVNARDAMPRGGRIVVTTAVLVLDRASAHARHLPGEGTFSEIVVRDDGIGMDQPTLARAFEPFFTTKAGKGTGLGLAMMYRSVKNHGGTVVLESILGVGTTVRIWLPVVS